MAFIALITDFGTQDHYAGVLKGVIAGIAPRATVVDISHEVRPHDVRGGAFILWQSWRWFPEESVFLVVVDPGVGTSRRILAARYASRYVVAPDNGVISFVHRTFDPEVVHTVERREFLGPEISSTFHGRDIMGPVAAHLATGMRPEAFGPAAADVELLSCPHVAAVTPSGLKGCVLHVDRFGTLVTNVHGRQIESLQRGARSARVQVNGVNVGPLRRTFADAPSGDLVAYVGSAGLLEVAVNRGRAVDRFGPAETVVVEVILSAS